LINPLPGIPLFESPLFESLLDASGFDDETKRVARDLNQYGVAVIDFPDSNFSQRASRIMHQLRDKYDWEEWWKNGWADNAGLRVQDAWRDNDDVRSIACNPELLRLLSRLYGRTAWPFQTLNFPVGTQQHFHSDAVFFSSIPERFMCGVWVALADIDENVGPLIYYPGSHKWPILTNDQLGCTADTVIGDPSFKPYESAWESLVHCNMIEPKLFRAKKGQALIWAANLLHGGSKQTEPGLTRWSQVTHYYFDQCCFYVPMYSDPFVGKISFKSVRNVLTGSEMPHLYDGAIVPQAFIAAVDSVRVKLPMDFSSEVYLELHPDVANSGLDAVTHYLNYGIIEGRPYNRPRGNPTPLVGAPTP